MKCVGELLEYLEYIKQEYGPDSSVCIQIVEDGIVKSGDYVNHIGHNKAGTVFMSNMEFPKIYDKFDDVAKNINNDSSEIKNTESNDKPLYVIDSGKLTSVNDGAIDCDGSFIIPDQVTVINDYAFSFNCKLKSIIIHDNIKYVGVGAFMGCENLKSVTLPNTLDKIRYDTFNNCHNLTSINIPDSIKTIECEAFKSCNNLDPNISTILFDRFGGEIFFNRDVCYI